MIDKPDPKVAGRTDSPGVKRPHATLDLKATEVRAPATPSTSASGASPSQPSSSASAASSSSASQSAAGASTASTGSKPSAPSAPAGAAKPSDPGAAPKSTGSKTEPAPAPTATTGGGGFFSHLLAGLVGGGLVYAGTAFLPEPPNSPTAQLSARIATLEAAPKDGADIGALNAKIDDAERQLAKLQELEQNVIALRDSQNSLQAETKSLVETTQNSGAAASGERLAKLEEQLAMIAASAPDSEGRLPQLAAVTGKISDLETSLANQIASLRKGLPADIEQRIAATAEASEAAKAASSRLDRELTQVRTDQARGTQQVEAQKASTDRLSAAVEAVREETARLSSVVGELRSSVESQLKSVTRPADVSAAIGPVSTKIAELEQNVQNVVQSEQSRKQDAERIVLSLELSNLKRALDRGQGQGYAVELEQVRKASAGQLDLGPLDKFKDTGVATLAQLKADFRPVMNAVIDADLEPADGSVIDRLWSGAKSVVRVRKVSHEADDTSTEAIVARIESALNDGQLGDVIAQAKALPQRAQPAIEDWLQKVTARHSVDQAIATLDGRLKASLSGAADVSPAPATPAPAPSNH
ncbi:hypothetical protein [Hyphomicrobium sp.]|uniref:hypothetical protein n=1 Tax=Hyphomicrobium sp. TaxID=82 RepID=UPI002E36876D|nr:hypothetical protein [Hyphomicrobium sp.]HEX2840783.1 hypothetical protein [Hyphomicrobium sp.]